MFTIKKFLQVAIIAVLLFKPVFPATDDDCEMCHSDPTLTAKRYGRTVSMYVDYGKFKESVHKNLQCIQCHTDANVKDFPHPENLAEVYCQNCHKQQANA